MRRRPLLKLLAAAGLGVPLQPRAAPGTAARLHRIIPATGESLPAIGMGSWLTFQVGNDEQDLAQRVQVLEEFFRQGGTLIDSSPMYGRSEAVIGHCLRSLGPTVQPFRATKVWIIGRSSGINQMEHSDSLWGGPGLDLVQVHNLLDWDTHLETLAEWKAAGRIRYTGLTTSHGRRHDEMENLIRTTSVDFVQFTYNFADREAEDRLLGVAAEHGKAVIINRPFDGGALLDAMEGKPLPGWAPEIGCSNWAQIFLKFVLSHPAVTCVIPATSSPAHMRENMGAVIGPFPDGTLRRRMVQDVERLRQGP